MAALFGGNPFSTPVGQLIEQATDGSLASENWALNMEICDMINETEEGPKDAAKAIKKKLSSNAGKNYAVIMYSLTVLETCVKNCGRRFHLQVAHKDFMSELIKVIGPKNEPPQIVQEKILSLIQGPQKETPTVVQEKILNLIQTWADAFKGQPELKEVEKVYMDLKKKGIEFPMTDLDKMAPIHTPARTHESLEINRTPQRAPTQPAQPTQPRSGSQRAPGQMVMATGPVTLTAEQLAKLRSELDIVQQNCKVFSEMLTEMTPGQEEVADLELLQELNRTCRQMQQRIVELLDKVQNEDVTEELLRINDDLNNVFLRFERFERYRTGQTGQMPAAGEAATLPIRGSSGPSLPPPPPVQSAADTSTGNLIDLDLSPAPQPTTQYPFAQNSNDIHLRLAAMNVGEGNVTNTLGQLNSTTAATGQPQDEFDMFAQSRQSFDQSKDTMGAGAVYANQNPDQFQGGLGTAVQTKTTGQALEAKPSDYDEMASWLEENPPPAAAAAGQESATSSEFDRFLAERAKEADNLPDLNPSDRQQRGGRQLQTDEAENTLFAL